jgi:hypothetical protein
MICFLGRWKEGVVGIPSSSPLGEPGSAVTVILSLSTSPTLSTYHLNWEI